MKMELHQVIRHRPIKDLEKSRKALADPRYPLPEGWVERFRYYLNAGIFTPSWIEVPKFAATHFSIYIHRPFHKYNRWK